MENAERDDANDAALIVLNEWLRNHALKDKSVSGHLAESWLPGRDTGRGAISSNANAACPVVEGDSHSDHEE
jgi:hypothetical protein